MHPGAVSRLDRLGQFRLFYLIQLLPYKTGVYGRDSDITRGSKKSKRCACSIMVIELAHLLCLLDGTGRSMAGVNGGKNEMLRE